MPRYTRCPYFQSEKRLTISCEDVVRRFKTLEAKWSHMDRYCDADYMSCPFAIDLRRAYEKTEKGDIRALDKEKITALQKEHAKLLSALGRAEKRIERQQKKIDELRAVNRSFTSVNNSLEQQKKDYYSRWRKAQDELDKGSENVMAELNKLGSIYEQRMCYLIENFVPIKMFYEDNAKAWAGDKAFALVADKDDDGRIVWKVVYQEDDKADDGRISGDAGDERQEEEVRKHQD